jgi:hypothetical protein
MRLVLRLAPLPLTATVALGFVWLLFPARTAAAVHVYELVLASVALALLVGVVRRAQPVARSSAFDAGLRRAAEPAGTLPELERLRREVTLATSTAFDVHVRLRPYVRRIATHLLASRRGIDLDAQPETARQLLGEAAWDLARADQPPPTDRNARGLGVPHLREVVAALERLT